MKLAHIARAPALALACVAALGAALLAGPARAALDADLLAGLEARAIGPAAMSGRIAAVDALASDPNFIVIGTATGGAWISRNGGLTWEAVFDDQPVASIGAVAIDPRNPDVIWVGTGEGNTRNSTSIGGGVFKSVDGGRNWRRVGLADSERIHRIALHPTDPDTVYVAALGTLWGPNTERGVFRTTDGGETWTRILYVDEDTGATDIDIDPGNPDHLVAAMWEHRRWPWFFKSGGPGSGLYVSWDGGETWRRKTEEDGLPKGELGRMSVSFSPADPERVYALVEAEKSALLRSDDGGERWTRVNEDHDIAPRPFYYADILADPRDVNRVYNIYQRVSVSIDGGKTFEALEAIDCCAPSNTIHIDTHALWINPADPRHMIVGNDGGIAISHDRGETFRFVRNLSLAQFYHVAVDDEVPYHVYGGLQDNGSWRGPSEVWENGGIRNLHWREVGFGDGFDAVPDPENARRGYSMSQGGVLYRWNLDTGEQRLIRPDPPTPETDLRFNWNAALAIDPFDPATIYYGSQFVHRSPDRGETWEVISGDLTSNDPQRQVFRESGGLTPDVTDAENNTTLVAIAPSALERGLIWVGSDDGRVHVTRDGGQDWERIDTRARGVPEGAWVPMIAPSPHQAGTAFVVFDDHRRSNMQPYVYRVDDYGRRWTSLVTDEIEGYALSVLQDPVDPELLFLGTEFGLWFSTDGGEAWNRFTAGVPTVSVMDMAIQRRETDLVLGTHGRGIFIIDDYAALRGLDAGDLGQRLALRDVTDAQRYTVAQTPSTRFTGSGEFRGPNEPYGAWITFIASGDDLAHPDADSDRERRIARRAAGLTGADVGGNDAADDDGKNDDPKVTVEIRDASGDVIRSWRTAVHQGLNRVAWNLRRDGVRPAPGENPDYDREDGLPAGPEVPPGRYAFSVRLGDEAIEGEFAVAADPREAVSAADIEANYRTLVDLLALQEAGVTALERIDRARRDLGTLGKLLGEAEDDAAEALAERAKALGKRLDEIEKRFRVPPETRGVPYADDRVMNHIAMAQSYVGSADAAPSSAALGYVDLARRALDDGLATLNGFLEGELATFRADVERAGIRLLGAAAPVTMP